MADDGLDKFINEIITLKNLPGLNEDVRMQLVIDLKERLLNKINRALIDALPEEKVNSLNDILDRENVSDDEVQQFIAQSGVNINKVTIETMLLFRDQYLQTSAERGV